MYKAEELCGLSIKPKINDIDLNVLQDYYRKFLNPFIYEYDITEDEKQRFIQLRFDEENFCHLLGIESIVKYSVSKNDIHNYRGQGGWNYIQNTGLSFNDLKKVNRSKFKKGLRAISQSSFFIGFYITNSTKPCSACDFVRKLEILNVPVMVQQHSDMDVRMSPKEPGWLI